MVQKEEGIWFLKDLIRQMWHKYMSKMEKNGAHKQLYSTVMWAVTRSAEESQNEERSVWVSISEERLLGGTSLDWLSVELIQDLDGLRQERREFHADKDEETNRQFIYSFKKTLNHAYMAKIVLGANNTVNKARKKNHFPYSLHSIKRSKMNGLLDKCYGWNKAAKMIWDCREGNFK